MNAFIRNYSAEVKGNTTWSTFIIIQKYKFCKPKAQIDNINQSIKGHLHWIPRFTDKIATKLNKQSQKAIRFLR